MYYEIFEDLCKKNNTNASQVSRATGISTATFTSWKKGSYTPKTDKLQKIADHFNVTLQYLTGTEEPSPTAIDEDNKPYFLDSAFLSLAQEAQDSGLNADEIQAIIQTIKTVKKIREDKENEKKEKKKNTEVK